MGGIHQLIVVFFPRKQMATPSKIGAVIRVSVGNFLEMYDFMVFGYYAAAIGRAFFPAQSEYASLMLSLMTFGTGYLMRPLGAIVLGAYIDHHGRRKGLLLTLGPDGDRYVVDRLPAGIRDDRPAGSAAGSRGAAGARAFSAGVEIGGVSVYLAGDRDPRPQGIFS